jgi:hypothetical protein
MKIRSGRRIIRPNTCVPDRRLLGRDRAYSVSAAEEDLPALRQFHFDRLLTGITNFNPDQTSVTGHEIHNIPAGASAFGAGIRSSASPKRTTKLGLHLLGDMQ